MDGSRGEDPECLVHDYYFAQPRSQGLCIAMHQSFINNVVELVLFLVGFALCQCLFVYSLSSHSGGADNFLSNYYRLAQPIGSVYYFMLAVCTVSVLDR